MKKGKERITVLFVCTHNSARSQMAEAFLNSEYGKRYEGYSAGTQPSKINPCAAAVMAEIGIDISKNRSKSIDEFNGRKFDYVVTVCDGARDACPYFPGAKNTIHAPFQNPSEFAGTKKEVLNGFRRVRDEIRAWVEKFGKE